MAWGDRAVVKSAFALLLSLFMCVEQGIALPPVSATLPAAVRTVLGEARAALVVRLEAFNAKAEAFSSRCAKVVKGSAEDQACGRDYQRLMTESAALEADKKAFANRVAAAAASSPCAAIEGQLARDNMAMSRLARIQNVNLAELKGATAQALEAQKDAIIDGGSLLLSGAVKQMAARADSARTYKAWVTRYTDAAKQRGANVDAIMAKADRAFANYTKAAAAAEAGVVAERGLDVADLFKSLASTARSIYALQQQADADLRAAVSDFTTQALASDVARGVLDTLSAASELSRFSPAYSASAYFVDYTYNGFKWWKALVEIEGQSQTLGDEVEAMRSLQAQIARTTKRLKACQAK